MKLTASSENNPRVRASLAVERIFSAGAFSNILLGTAINGGTFSARDRALFTALVYGTAERMRTLRHILGTLAAKPPQRLAEAVVCVGLYQILYMDSIPDGVACNESVKVARSLLSARESGFVNAVLRRVCREKETVLRSVSQLPGPVRYSVSDSFYGMIKSGYPDRYEEIFESFFSPRALSVTVNTLRISQDGLLERLSADGIECEALENLSSVITSGADRAVSMLDEGLFFVQSLPGRRAVAMLDAAPDMTVVDVCASPGGKSFSAAVDMKNRGRVLAFDIHANKLPPVEKGARTLGIDIITAACRDAREPDDSLAGLADRVICDVPCSSTGVAGHKPEIRYKDVSDISRLTDTQYAILSASSGYLKNGGVLVYSTCSLDRRENEDIVRHFLAGNGGFTLLESFTSLPCDRYCDGVYSAKLIIRV